MREQRPHYREAFLLGGHWAMMSRLILIVLIFAIPSATQVKILKEKRRAEAEIIWDGNALHDLCQHYKEEKLRGLGAGCFWYIAGATQTILLTHGTEIPPPCPGKGVTHEQIVDVVVKWLDDHPEKRDWPAPYVVVRSLDEAFPCN
ncbi:MAG: hypothetical protein M3O09_00790 [Acidobacteriota bacterium]|nr:hypothetical protein [Acidobacteriota bacterium]